MCSTCSELHCASGPGKHGSMSVDVLEHQSSVGTNHIRPMKIIGACESMMHSYAAVEDSVAAQHSLRAMLHKHSDINITPQKGLSLLPCRATILKSTQLAQNTALIAPVEFYKACRNQALHVSSLSNYRMHVNACIDQQKLLSGTNLAHGHAIPVVACQSSQTVQGM